MRVLLCSSRKIGSWAIRVATWSTWSHAVIVDGDVAIEAVWPKVRMAPLADVIANHDAFAVVDLPCVDELAAIEAARSQVGKGYDWRALIGFATRSNTDDPSRWFCSELVAWAFEQAGSPLFRKGLLRRITPQHIWMLPGKDV